MNDELRVKNNELGGKMNYRYRTDEEMKDNESGFLERIPNDWKVAKAQYYFNVYAGGTPSTNEPAYWDGDIPWINSGEVQNCIVKKISRYITERGLEESSTKLIPKNTTLLAMTGATCGKVGYLTFDSTANQSVMAFTEPRNCSSKFLFYYLICQNHQIEYFKTGGAQGGINVDNGKKLYINIPSKTEQEKIAKFLDEKTVQFDSIISKKEALIEKLEEAKKSLISEVVTGKVKVVKTNDGYELVERKKEEMKDSGVEWLGLVPKGWKIIKLKYLATLMNKKVKSNSVDKYIGLENVESKTGFIISYTDPEKVESDLSTYFDRNMVLFGKLRPYLAKCVVTETSGICSDEFLVLRTLRLSPNILKYIMLNSEFIDLVNSSTYGAKMPRANWDFISNIKVPFFSADEQTIIEEFIIYKCNSIDKIINIKKQQIEKLKEAKQSLISEAVTGKIEILD